MPNKQILDIVTDLRRCVLCISHNNLKTAQSFLIHADSIFHQIEDYSSLNKLMHLDLQEQWDRLYTIDLESNPITKDQVAEKLLTFSSLLFLRSLYARPTIHS